MTSAQRANSLKTGVLAATAATVLLAGNPAHAQQSASGPVKANTAISLAYDFIGNGFKILRLKFEIALAKDGYTASTSIRTKGVGAWLSSMKSDSMVKGVVKPAGLLPQMFGMRTRRSDKKRTYDLKWAKDGTITITRSKKMSDYKARAIEAAVMPGMSDPITALMMMSLFRADTPCDGNYRVVNGKEVFSLKVSLAGKDKIRKSDGGAYRGDAYVCDIVYTPLAGLSRKKMAAFRNKPIPPIRVWMAPVRAATFDKPMLIPVKVRATINWVRAVAYMRKGTINGRPLNAQSQASR